MQTQENKGLNISVKSFITAIAVVLVLMVLTYGLTFVIPGGEYARIPDANGNMIIDSSSEFTYVEGGMPFWKWLLSPVLVLGASGNGTLIAVIVFLLVIGGDEIVVDSGKEPGKSPETGDSSAIAFAIVMMAIAAAAVVVTGKKVKA